MTTPNILNGGQVIVDYLVRERVPYVFGLCGHGNIGFLDALYERASDIKTISVHHETVAGFMADVYSRLAGKPTATFTSCGPGSANLPIALANAYLDSVPFLAITGNVPTSQFNRGAFQELYRHYQADFPSTVRSCCKHVFHPARGDMVPLAIRQAWKTMVTGRPGPVVLDVPFDIFKEAAAEESPKPEAWNANISCRCGADPEGVAKAVDMLLAAERPVILVGQGVKYGGAAADLLRLAERLRIPVAWSASGTGAIDSHHPLALGLVARNGPYQANHAARTADGYRRQWNAFIAPGFVEDGSPIPPQRAAHEIDKALPEDAILVSDIGVHHNWLIQFCRPRRPDSLIGSMGFGPMGFGVAGVLGAQFAAPERPCVSVCGDGAFFMHASVLGTAVEYDLPVVWVVWNNFAYASIRGLQRGYLGGRELATDFRHPSTGAPYNPDFAAMARSAGIAGVNVDRAGDLSDALREALVARKPYLINANISADKNPGGAGVWELPGLGQSQPAFGGRYQP